VAAPTTVARRIDASLRDLEAEVSFLPEFAAYWPEESETAQISYMLEWDELMDRLRGLERAYRSGRMTPEQAERYRALLGKLSEALPIIERLGLTSPPVSLTP
jgi:hypothetical protein